MTVYTVYKTTHVASGKFYIGFHQTSDPDDGYLGSGKHLRRAMKKYGKEAFTKEVLFVFDNLEDMISKEKELVTEEFVLRDDTYNLNVGGDGGWSYANAAYDPVRRRKPKGPMSEDQKVKISNTKKGHQTSLETRAKISASRKGQRISEATLLKMSISKKNRKALRNESEHVSVAHDW